MERNSKWRPAMSLAVIVAATQGVGAAEIRLQLKGGGFEITGELYSYDGASYVVNSPAFGKMTIDGRRFDCLGDNCPKRPVNLAPAAIGAVSGDIVIAGSNTIGSALMPGLIEAFARRTGLEATRAVGNDPRDLTIQLLNKGGRQVASLQLSRYGSSAAFRELETRQTEIGMSSRRITDPEVAKLAAAGLGNMLQPTHGATTLRFRCLSITLPRFLPAKSMTGRRSGYRQDRSTCTRLQQPQELSRLSTNWF